MWQSNVAELIGNTPLLRIPSLSELTGCDILVKCEFLNPGGSIKDRAALQIVQEAMQQGELEKGMTIVEGTAGNTGVGLAMVARSMGVKALIVMPNDQSPEKSRLIQLYGAELQQVDPCPFANPAHFYHQAREIAAQRSDAMWANQFENLSNFRAHYQHTGPEIWQQTDGKVDIVVSAAGTGGTIAGVSRYLKQQNGQVQVWSVDPDGSGVYHYLQHGEYKSQGRSMTEGIGIMRLVDNFRQARIDTAINISDEDIVTIARHVRDQDGLLLGSSSALNVAGAFMAAVQQGPGLKIVTFACDAGERSAAKLYNPDFLAARELGPRFASINELKEVYQSVAARAAAINVNWGHN